jgi:hypothetical protein
VSADEAVVLVDDRPGPLLLGPAARFPGRIATSASEYLFDYAGLSIELTAEAQASLDGVAKSCFAAAPDCPS